jgi:dipeptide/tripeptide permease
VKIVDSFAYFALSQIIIIYLHDEFGLTDIQAGAVYGFWGAAVLLWGLATSFINDNIGVRTALLIGYVISFITLLVMAVTTSLAGILVCMFIFLPLGNSMGIPMLTIGIKRFTNRENRAFAFGIFYSCMNIGAVFSGAIVDFFNIGYKEGVPVLGTTISGNRMVVFSCAISVIFSFMVTFLFLRDIKVTEQAEAAIDSTKDFEEYKPKQQTFWVSMNTPFHCNLHYVHL